MSVGMGVGMCVVRTPPSKSGVQTSTHKFFVCVCVESVPQHLHDQSGVQTSTHKVFVCVCVCV